MTSGPESDDRVRAAYDLLLGAMKLVKSPAQAAADLALVGMAPDLIEAALARLRERAESSRILTVPEALVDPARLGEPWYPGPTAGDRFWPTLEAHLREGGLAPTAVESIDKASTKIVGLVAPPWQDPIRSRGLVLGHVQSGKTSNFTAVIAKAADAGYRLFIVLSGVHNNLRRQTQVRLDSQLRDLTPGAWIDLTSPTADFGSAPNPDALLTVPDRRFLCVVKKNKKRLARVVDWLDGAAAQSLRSCPILVIDDEADQASVNTAEEAAERTTINRLIVRLLAFPKVAYVGYTATPFANLFVDPSIPEDIYPRDFIVDLPRPAGYFGPERIFGRELLEHDDEAIDDGLDMVRRIDRAELSDLQPPRGAGRAAFEPRITSSLQMALEYFVLASAARRARGQRDHSTMLVHTTQYTDVHLRFRDPFLVIRDRLTSELAREDGELLRRLRNQWRDESAAVLAQDLDEAPVAFDDLLPHVGPVIAAMKVVVDNYRSLERLEYGDEPQVVVVIGGNTLSRGLTLEGLVVSYFIRTASTYDTLLQMARWFGYRAGYQDLPRIWMTEDLEEWFRHLATVEAEIRIDVRRYENDGVTPLTYATRIRTHPQLAITSAMKMRHAKPIQVSYAGRRLQTILFEHQDAAWLAGNLAATRDLIRVANVEVGSPQPLGFGRMLFSTVDVGAVRAFLGAYQFHPNAIQLNRDALFDYIAAQNEFEDLIRWNVVVMSRSRSPLGTLDLGLEAPVGLINRARLASSRPYADIKSLMSRVDRVVDLGLSPEELRGDADALQRLRPPSIGLLLIYPISKDSTPQGREIARVPLDAADHIVGVGIVFPDVPPTRRWSAVDYVAVELPEAEAEPEEVTDEFAQAMADDEEADFVAEGAAQ